MRKRILSLVLVISVKSSVMIRSYFSPQNVNLSQLHVPGEEDNEISSSTMIDCTVSLQFKMLFLIIGVSLYVATGIFSWSCIFPGKHVVKPSGFKIIKI